MRPIRGFFLSGVLLCGMFGFRVVAQRAPAAKRTDVQTATTARAEVAAGALSTLLSKPGDRIAVRLAEDIKSNGQVVLRKGSMVTGIVRDVRMVDSKASTSGQSQSLLELEWFAPEPESADSRFMFAVQSFKQVGSVRHDDSGPAWAEGGGAGNTAESPQTEASDVAVASRTNQAFLSLPSIVAADPALSSILQADFGFSDRRPIYKTGRGEMIMDTGLRQPVELFSRLSNDTVMMSLNKNFEIAAGAQIQLLIGVQRK